MNNLTKLGIAGSLALGSVGAHASITVPSSSGTTGDVVLFADIFNGTTLVAAYAGDTGATVASVGAGTKPTSTFDDANLTSFLSQATSGTTVLWAVEGGGGTAGASPYLVSSSPSANLLYNSGGPPSGAVMAKMGSALLSQITIINSLIGSSTASSLLTTNDSLTQGTGFNPIGNAADLSDWGGYTNVINSSGLGSSATLYTLTAANQGGSTNGAIATSGLTVSLTSAGLVYSSGTAPVPLPAAVWLLGSGLLGLAGVGRRKNKAA